MLDDNCNFLNFDEFKIKYPGLRTNQREFFQVINSIKEYLNKTNVQIDQINRRIELPKFWHIIVTGGSKAIYNMLKHTNKKPSPITRWETVFQEEIQWENIFTEVIKTTTDPQLKWFQIRTIYRLIPTNRFLYLRKIKDNPSCTFGCNEEETITHLLYQCPIVYQFWNQVLTWVKSNCTNCDTLSFSEQLVIFGIKRHVITDKVVDLLLLTGKWHIYKCKLQNREPSIDIFKQQFKERYTTERLMNIARLKVKRFDDAWLPYKQLVQ